MRLVDLTKSQHHINKHLDRVWKIYDSSEEAIADGVPAEDILTNWKLLRDNDFLIAKVRELSLWVVTDDDFVPDYFDVREYKTVFLLDSHGNKIPTKGCVVQVTEYYPASGKAGSRPYFRTPTGSWAFDMRLTSEKRRKTLSFSKHRSIFSSPKTLSKSKRKAAFLLLSPASPSYGRLGMSLLAVYPGVRRFKNYQIRSMALKFFNQPWFYRLIKQDYLMSMLVQDVKSELTARGMGSPQYIANMIEKAMKLAEEGGKAKDILAVLEEIKSYMKAETSSAVPPAVEPQQLKSPVPEQLVPHLDGADSLSTEASDKDVLVALSLEGDVINANFEDMPDDTESGDKARGSVEEIGKET